MSPTIRDEPPVELEDVRAGRLPERYGYQMQSVLLERLEPLLVPGVAILDVGAGRSPTIAREQRPAGCRYVGLDISAQELDQAEPRAYDEKIVQDVGRPLIVERPFDIVISWQVLEHVHELDRAFENLRLALRPGGTLLAQLSGSYAAFALLARVMPHRLRVWAMTRFLGHPEELKFPTHYDRCYSRALRAMLSSWSSVEIVSFYRGAGYFGAFRPLQVAYLAYEAAIERRALENLATHYLVVARC
jgi:SAM-dependent methyltransferase